MGAMRWALMCLAVLLTGAGGCASPPPADSPAHAFAAPVLAAAETEPALIPPEAA